MFGRPSRDSRAQARACKFFTQVFRREKFIEFGGPDGGNGGRGGDVVAECVDGLNTLIDYRYQQHFKAQTGGHGMGKNRSGAGGADMVLKVPEGHADFR